MKRLSSSLRLHFFFGLFDLLLFLSDNYNNGAEISKQKVLISQVYSWFVKVDEKVYQQEDLENRPTFNANPYCDVSKFRTRTWLLTGKEYEPQDYSKEIPIDPALEVK